MRKRGYGLVHIILFFGVIVTILGMIFTVILQSGRKIDIYSERAMNLNEGENNLYGAYGVMGEYVERGLDYSLVKTEEEINRLIEADMDELKRIGEELASGVPIEEISADNLHLYKKNGEMNDEKLKEKRDELYRRYYLEYFNLTTLGKTNLRYMIDNILQLSGTKSNGGIVTLFIKNNNELSMGGYTVNDDFKILLEIESELNHNSRKIGVEIQFDIPKYSSKIVHPWKYMNISVNPVIKSGVVVGGRTDIQGKVTIEGGMYVKGNQDVGINMLSEDSVLKLESGNLSIAEGLKYDYNYPVSIEDIDHKGSLVEIKNGSLFVKNISMGDSSEENQWGSQGSKLKVKNEVFVYDDLQIEEEKCRVNVGNYYGISDGSSSENNVVDNSSSIIINSLDIGDSGTKIVIDEKIILAGTSYIKNLTDPVGQAGALYQTGESISILGNYAAYTASITSDKVENLRGIGEVNLKYDIGKTRLDPLSLVSYVKKEGAVFYLFTKEEKYMFGANLDNDYKKLAKGISHFEIENHVGKMKFNRTYEITEELYDRLKDELRIDIDLYRGNNKERSMELARLDSNFEASLFTSGMNRWIKVHITSRGEAVLKYSENYICEDLRDEEEKKEFGVFYPVKDDSALSKSLEINVFDKFGSSIETGSVILEKYEDKYENLTGEHKSIYFKQFYDDYRNDGIIKGTDGITVGDMENSIYTGAIISGNGVSSSNYYSDPYSNEMIIRHKEDILKDKIYFMDLFEKKFEGDEDNPFAEKNIEDFNMMNDRGTYEQMVQSGKTPRMVNSIEISPSSFISVEGNEELLVNDLRERGLYINLTGTNCLLYGVDSDNTGFTGESISMREFSEGIILIKGDLEIRGTFTFTGTIIVLGNLLIEESSDVRIVYDEGVVTKVLTQEQTTASQVFKEHFVYKDDKKGMIVFKENDDEAEDFPLKISKWVVIK